MPTAYGAGQTLRDLLTRAGGALRSGATASQNLSPFRIGEAAFRMGQGAAPAVQQGAEDFFSGVLAPPPSFGDVQSGSSFAAGPPIDPSVVFGDVQAGSSSTAPGMFDDVQSGASSTALPPEFSAVKNAPPQAEPESYLRYSLGGPVGPRETGKAFGQSYTKPMAPDPRTFQEFNPSALGRGTVSMMTAPENVAEMTFASRMEGLERQAAENQLRQLAEDPFYLERQKQQAEIDKAVAIERGKLGVQDEREAALVGRLQATDAEIDADVVAQIQELKSRPDYATSPPELQKAAEQNIIDEAAEKKQAFRQNIGLAKGRMTFRQEDRF